MVLLNACLNQFIQPVPVCSETEDWTIALAVLSQAGAADRLVLLNDRHQPTGLISLRNLLSLRLVAAEPAQPMALIPALCEPLVLLPQTLSVGEVLPHLQVLPQPHYAIVQTDGAFLGLLDHAKLLRFLTLPQPDGLAPAPAITAEKTELKQQIKRQQRIIQRREPHPGTLRGRDLASTAPLSAAASDFVRLNPLPGLIEHLPLPLMLQTSDGQVLAQNSLWREQVGALLDPSWIRQEAAVLLETPIADGRSDTPPPSLPPSFESDSLASGNWCQRGAKPNSCICSCTLKSGQEQILQFVKIPIGTLSQPASPSPMRRRSAATQAAENWSETFRLATLSSLDEAAPESAASTTATLWLVLAQDITEQQQLARELTAKNADLIQLNRLKDEFLACISHELRTPLTAILGLASLLKDQTLGALNPRQTHYTQLIYQSGRHLMSVVNDILDLTRIETGQLELLPEPVDIATVCDRAFQQARARSLEDQAADGEARPFLLEIEPGLEFLIADETRLRQMLMHLLSNALKFTDPETDPDRSIGLKVDRWGGWIAFTVWDRGIGIPADKQHLIFQKFQQLENPLTRQFEGAGLGLVLTQRLARLHGGDVTFLSKEGEGSQFTILLPPRPPHKNLVPGEDVAEPLPNLLPNLRPDPLPNSLPSQELLQGRSTAVPYPVREFGLGDGGSRSRLVLVVEAAPQFIENLSEQLTGLGYRVVVARTGTEALEKARRLQPCITFLNPLLPQLSGWDVLTLLKSSQETRQIPVVMMSTQVDEAQAHHSHADGLISLPVQSEALRHSLRRWVTEAMEPQLQSRDSALTILRLSPDRADHPRSTTNLNPLLHSHHYQVLEADDLEQAELLTRVWKPIVVLLDRAPAHPVDYFQQFSQYPLLAALPLVTLDQETTLAANQTPGLLVFPCLRDGDATDQEAETSALLQAIEVAAGYTWRPSILVVDLATLLPSAATAPICTDELGCFPKEAEWLRALTQYLQAAGFQGIVGQGWQEVLQQLQSQRVEALLLGWTDAALSPEAIELLATLQKLEPKPPILVLDHRQHTPATDGFAAPLPDPLRQLATQVLPPSMSMMELLEQIRWAIGE